MKSFDQFRAEWYGQRVGDDTLVALHEETNDTKYQCVSLIKQYLRECFAIEPGIWGNAIQWWTSPNQSLLASFARDGSGLVQKGDIVILRTLGHTDFASPGHIGIATGEGDPNSIEILEQNGQTGNGRGEDGDAIRTRYVPRNRLAGVLRPQHAPVVLPAPYKVQDIPTKTIRLRQAANLWDMTRRTFDDMSSSPIRQYPADYEETVAALCHHDNGESYYMVGNNETTGFNVRDCYDYYPPIATPQVIATQNVPVPKVEKYTLITRVMRFDTATNALHHQNYAGDLGEGQYIVISKQEKAYNLSDDNMKDRGWWVNIDDNKIPEPVIPTLPVDPPPAHDEPADFPPVIEQPKIVSHSLKASGEVVMYQATNSQPVEIRDYQTGMEPITMQPYNYSSATGKNEPVPLVSTFTVNGTEYGRTQKVSKAGWFYGVPMSDLELYELPEVAWTPVGALESTTKTVYFDTNKDGKVDLKDFTDGISDFIDYGSKWFHGSIAPIVPKLTEAKQKLSKSVDGFSKRSK